MFHFSLLPYLFACVELGRFSVAAMLPCQDCPFCQLPDQQCEKVAGKVAAVHYSVCFIEFSTFAPCLPWPSSLQRYEESRATVTRFDSTSSVCVSLFFFFPPLSATIVVSVLSVHTSLAYVRNGHHRFCNPAFLFTLPLYIGIYINNVNISVCARVHTGIIMMALLKRNMETEWAVCIFATVCLVYLPCGVLQLQHVAPFGLEVAFGWLFS